MKIFSIAGTSGSGKTVLVEQLIPRLVARGLRVAVIKHTHHDFDLDRPGKDSWRHRQAGAQEVMVVGPQFWAIFHELRGAPEPTLDELVGRLSPCDVVLVEGFKRAPIPKLEVFRPANGKPPLYADNPHVVAVASDTACATTLPQLDLNDLEAIAAFVVDFLAHHAASWPPVAGRAEQGSAYGIAGWSGSGKTTLLERLIPECTRRGLRVSVIKHAHKGFDIDQPGKDSHRLRAAGASEVILSGPRRWGLIHELAGESDPSLTDCRARLAPCDLLLVEGFKQDALPKLEVFRGAHGRSPMYPDNPMIRGVASDTPLPTTLPLLDLNDPRRIADFVLAQVGQPGKAVGDAAGDGVGEGGAQVNATVPEITGVILAGGLGRRMGGVDKGLQELDGRPMVSWVLQRLQPQVREVLISANQNAEVYRALGCPVVPDRIEGFAGPLAGLHAALSADTCPLVLTVPCDSPFLPADLAARLLAALQDEGADIAVAKTFDQLHPVFCLCRREVLPSLTAYLAAGDRKIERWLASCKVAVVAFDDEAEAFSNINTNEELRRFARGEPGAEG